MSKRCEICGKAPQYGNNISHAHNKTKRRWLPNLQSVRTVDASNGEPVRRRVCTKCIKANKVQKYVRFGE